MSVKCISSLFRFAFVDMFVLFWANMETSAIQEGTEISAVAM